MVHVNNLLCRNIVQFFSTDCPLKDNYRFGVRVRVRVSIRVRVRVT